MIYKISLLVPVSIIVLNIIMKIFKLDKNCIQYKILNGIRICYYVFLTIIFILLTYGYAGMGVIMLIAVLSVISLVISSIGVLIINFIYKMVKKESITNNFIHTILITALLIFSILYIYSPIALDAQIGVIG